MNNRKTALNQTTVYAIANISNKAASFLMLPIFTRYLSPADFGVISLLVFSLTIFQTIFGARLGHALPKFYHEKKSQGSSPHLVISTAYIATLVVSIVVTAILFLARTPLSEVIFGNTEYALITGIFFICLLTQSIEVYGFIYLRIMERPMFFLYASLVKLFLQLGLNIYLIVYLELGVMGVVISAAVYTGVFALFFSWYLIKENGVKYDHQTAVILFIYCIPLWLSSLAGIYIWSSSRYFIRIFSSLDDVGLFELASKMASILIAIFWEPFVMYWNTQRFDLYYKKVAKTVYSNTFDIAMILLVSGLIGICVFSGPVITLMADEKFHASVSVVSLLVIGSFFYAIAEFANFGFMVKNKTKYIAGIDTTTAIILTALYILLIPKLGFLGAGIAMMIAQFCQFIAYYNISKKHFDMELKFGFLYKTLLIAAIALIIDLLFKVDNIILSLAGKSAICAISIILIFMIYISKPGARKILHESLPERITKYIPK